MKKIIYILFAALLSASCSGELDIPSQMSLSANQELNSSDVDKLLNGLYASTVNPSVMDILIFYSQIFWEMT